MKPAQLGPQVEEVLLYCQSAEFEHLVMTSEPMTLVGTRLPGAHRGRGRQPGS
ncbi:hypothetical protein [Lentzea sp. NEAU-D7]|uniref:hypothetical protein n=1 Tax=Lentzea sp. NEAU-D7 TaxID=2994667 RepID=UPI00224B0220|nr:hypothetical protein [Lentzea sp. NEAU-D7]MCX2954587.1 hypothetical protein [Lentzea sp. NEAU-D7]